MYSTIFPKATLTDPPRSSPAFLNSYSTLCCQEQGAREMEASVELFASSILPPSQLYGLGNGTISLIVCQRESERRIGQVVFICFTWVLNLSCSSLKSTCNIICRSLKSWFSGDLKMSIAFWHCIFPPYI